MYNGQVSVNYIIFLLHYAYCCCCFCGTRWTVSVSAVVAIAVGVAAAAGGTSRCSIPQPGSHPQRCAADAAAVADVFVYHREFLSHNKPTSAALVPPFSLSTDNIPNIHIHIHIDIDAAFFRLQQRLFILHYLVNVFRNAIVYRTEQSTADRPALAEHFYFSNVNTK